MNREFLLDNLKSNPNKIWDVIIIGGVTGLGAALIQQQEVMKLSGLKIRFKNLYKFINVFVSLQKRQPEAMLKISIH